MRVALACPYAWDDPGGVQVQVRELGERLRDGGHEVLVLTPARTAPQEEWVRVVGRPVDIPYNASNAPIDPRPWSRAAVRHALAGFGPDVVHAHQPTAPSTGLWATLEARAPVVGTFHSGAGRARLYDLAAPVLRRVMRRLAIRTAVSERAAGFEEARIGGTYEIVPNGLDVARFSKAQPADLGPGRKLLFVGRLDARKGFSTALQAFQLLAKLHEDLRLVVVGEGSEGSVVSTLAEDLRGRVTMLGAVRNAELPPVATSCDLYLGPAIGGESFGVVLIEAMAAGLPVVASDIPGYDEVLTDGVDGLLVPPGDTDALASAAGRILEDAQLAERLATAGRERAASFDWSVILPAIEDVYARALRTGPASLR